MMIKRTMKLYTHEQWTADPTLKKWIFQPAVSKAKCTCGTDEHHVELIDHESCIVGRIDTIVCTKCDEVVSFRIIR